MAKKRAIGLHLRLTTTLPALLARAQELASTIVQCFFVHQADMSYVSFAPGELEASVALIKKKFTHAYLHGSYWINLAGKRHNGWRVFRRELALAKAVGFTHMIIHPGSAKSCETRQEGIELLAKCLNRALEKEDAVTIMLENTAHGGMSLGGDLQDFKILMTLIEKSEKIEFCIDSAHAYAYGYDISTVEGLEKFIEEIEDTIGCNRVTLLHLNDIHDACGSKIDQHMVPGEGKLGLVVLERFMNHPKLQHAAVILELPNVTPEQEEAVLTTVRSWKPVKNKK